MKFNKLLTKISLIVATTACSFIAVFLLYFIYQTQNGEPINLSLAFPASVILPLKKEEAKTSIPLPVRIQIPHINIDTAVEYVGLTPGGAVGVPKGAVNVAWYNLSSRPGEIGNSVIDGHSGYKDNKPAVFDNLYKLKKGDKIYVQDKKGATLTFVVQSLKSYDRNDDVRDVFESSDGLSHLNLITCAGDWNPIAKTHSSRLVVFTNREV